MKTITIEQLEKNFDKILNDVKKNKETYLIKYEKGDCVLLPYGEELEEYLNEQN